MLLHCRFQGRDLVPFPGGLLKLRDEAARPTAHVPPPLLGLLTVTIFSRGDPLLC
jgi:hypothetical protein